MFYPDALGLGEQEVLGKMSREVPRRGPRGEPLVRGLVAAGILPQSAISVSLRRPEKLSGIRRMQENPLVAGSSIFRSPHPHTPSWWEVRCCSCCRPPPSSVLIDISNIEHRRLILLHLGLCSVSYCSSTAAYFTRFLSTVTTCFYVTF